ncbi:unnamed protein product [Trichobilharzia szidati]|nr:unnamed protein product [Trichobilharzia szidati]
MSATPPKALVLKIANKVLTESDECASGDILRSKRVYNFHADSFQGQSSKNWCDLLSSADSIIPLSDWSEISNLEGKTSVSDVNARLLWIHRLQPNINRSKWSDEEDKRLTELVQEYGEYGRWDEICKALNTKRTTFACIQRWQTVLNPNFILYRPWSTSEDTALMDILKNLLNSYSPGLMDWDIVSAYHPTRSAYECRSRAPEICSAFKNIVPKLRGVVERDVSVNSEIKNQVYISSGPFSLEEDLQLLMAVQRYGTAGGRIGHGGGTGVGSWALVTTALPGRSASSCRKRYLELCEQFQPWTCYEDHKLYNLVLNYGPYVPIGLWNTCPSLQIFNNIMPYFPGRSAWALQSRFRTLRKWAKLWNDLRNRIPAMPQDSTGCNSSSLSSPSQESILIYSPLAKHFVSQLRNAGVPDPETEAYRTLTSWKKTKLPVKSNYTWLKSDWKPNQIDQDFMQLLSELASGVLIQQHLQPNDIFNTTDIVTSSQLNDAYGLEEDTTSTTTATTTTTNAVTTAPSSSGNINNNNNDNSEISNLEKIAEISNQDLFGRLPGPQSKWMIYQTQVKHVLVGPIRRQLYILAGVPIPSSLAPSSSLSVSLRPSSVYSQPRTINKRKDSRALLLLRKEHLFWMTFDRAMCDPKVKLYLRRITKISMLRNVGPLIARIMVSHLGQKPIAYRTHERLKKFRYRSRTLRARKSTRCKRALRKTTLEKHGISSSRTVNHSNNNSYSSPSTTQLSVEKDNSLPANSKNNSRRKSTRNTTSSVNKTACNSKSTTTRTTATASVTASTSTENNDSLEVTTERCRALLRIRNLLKLYGERRKDSANLYSLNTSAWYQREKATTGRACAQRKYMPLVFRNLPQKVCTLLYSKSVEEKSRELALSQSCYVDTLDVDKNGVEVSPRTRRTTTTTTNDSSVLPTLSDIVGTQFSRVCKPDIIPPNYATFLGFKSVLMHLSTLLTKERSRFSQFVEFRNLLNMSPGNTNTNEETKKKIRNKKPVENLGRPLFAVSDVLLSERYTNFINRSLCMFILPAILSQIPAEELMDSAKHYWEEAYEYAISHCSESTTEVTEQNAKSNDAGGDDNDVDINNDNNNNNDDDDDYVPVTRNKRKPKGRDYPVTIAYKRLRGDYSYSALRDVVESKVNSAKRTNSTTTFTIVNPDGVSIPLTLPNKIRILHACGFQADSFLNLKK